MKRLFAQYIDDTTLDKVVKEIINQENIFLQERSLQKLTERAYWHFLQTGAHQSVLQYYR